MTSAVPGAGLARLRATLARPVVTAADAGYAARRAVWNGMVDRRPALIATCGDVGEVQAAVRFAREHALALAVRGGGHSLPGFGTCDGGLVLSLAGLRTVQVDPAARTVRVGGGCLLGDVDAAAQRHGLAVPAGVVSHTGVGGLTLGGGVGLLMRKHGLTIDNLLSAQVVTADGAVVRASADDNPDLFWALRGGGGNFGVVTEFEFQAHPVGPDVLGVLVAWPLEHAREVFDLYRDFAATAPRELASLVFLFTVPGEAPYPEAARGRPAVGVVGMWSGPVGDGLAAVAPLRGFGAPLVDLTGPRTYLFMQSMSDEVYPWGRRYYMKTGLMDALPPAAVEVALDAFADAPHPALEVDFHHLGGAVSDVAREATAFPGRTAQFAYDLPSAWDDPADDAAVVEWTRRTARALDTYAAGSYLNVEADTGQAVSAKAWGPNWGRLVQVKRRYDPENFFHLNPNIEPGV